MEDYPLCCKTRCSISGSEQDHLNPFYIEIYHNYLQHMEHLFLS